MNTMIYLNPHTARQVCAQAVKRRGVSTEHAKWFANALVDTSLMGVDTHGLRLLPLYLRELDEGRSHAIPNIHVQRRNGNVMVLDADQALGTGAGMYAAKLAVQEARSSGIAAVGVGNSNHFGAASVYGLEIANSGMIGIVTTSAAARMAPFKGKQPMFGTNPICFTAPADEQPFVLDMATSQISYSQVKHYRKLGLSLPLGWALDKDGNDTAEPDEVVSLSPLGGYKGQGLAMMVQVLSCLLTGMPLDHQLDHLDTGSFSKGRQIGHFMIALDISAFTDLRSFQSSLAGLMETIRSTPAQAGERINVAGDPQAQTRRNRLIAGIPASEEEASVLMAEARLCGLEVTSVLMNTAEVTV